MQQEGVEFISGEEPKKRRLDEDGNASSPFADSEDLRALLEPLSKEQLVDVLSNAGFQYPAIADDIREVASKDPAHRKLFVRGLAWETSSEALRDVFKEYGEIEEGAVITDKNSGKSRGYGFITFKHMDSAQRALAEPSKFIDGRIAVCNLAVTGTHPPVVTGDLAQRKLFIGSLSYETTTETLISVFSQYGDIEEGSVAYDKVTNKSRGFAFMTFKSVEAARRALADPNKTIEGRNVVIKLALEGLKEKPATQMVPQFQPGYAVNPNIAGYARAPLQGSAGVSGYSSNFPSYGNQPSYAALAGAQYGVGVPGQFGSATYSQYAQGAQSGPLTGSVIPGYYGAPS
ncbi:hypothetical protein L7F22_007569 [Adiantum nelumboides]|nr:hypothetical protein [Adiantum nelumboides]